MGTIGEISKFSKKNRLLVTILISSIAVVFSFLAVLLYINYYARVSVILTTITWYEDGDVKNVTEYDIVTIKKGRSVNTLPTPSVEGYKFGGWFFDKECKKEYDYETLLEENIQLYGKLNLLEYSIELVLDENTKVVNNYTQQYDYSEKFTIEDVLKLPRVNDSVAFEDGTESSISEYKQLYREGYTFEGWGFSSSAYNTVAYDFRMNAQNLTFYAVWKPISVNLKYCTLDLSFAQNNPQSGSVQDRISATSGGLMYNTFYQIYVSETMEYNTKVNRIIEPIDEYKNFEFAGWYLDPDFRIPVKFAQLYIRNGYFTLTREINLNILQDPLYFDDGHILTDEQLNEVSQYSSRNENDSYILLFAKWELKKYTVKFNLNLPDAESYVDTSNMTDIINAGTPLHVYADNGNTLKIKTNVYQGQNLKTDYFNNGVLYDDDYFNNVIYIKNDLTGLPLYTLRNWNSKKDGMGYDATTTSDRYFDKSNFDIVDDEIIVYAQWTSYYRVNYYLTGVADENILLSTINVESNKISMPELNSLVLDLNGRELSFTEKQIFINESNVDMSQTYYTPLNKTFVGWSNESVYSMSSPLYIEGIRYNIGTTINRNAGIYLNEPVRNLYTAWIENINTFHYDLGADGIEKTDFSKNSVSQNMENAIIQDVNGVKSYKEYEYETTNSYFTLITIYNEQFLITKSENGELYSLNGWSLRDGYKIPGDTNQEIKFNRSSLYVKFINNSDPDMTKFKELSTGVYFEGLVEVDNDRYYTRYDTNEDRSYIILRARNYVSLVFNAMWVKNITLTYNAGVDDAVWASGYSADTLTNTAGGSVYIQFSDPAQILSRPYYRFYGWSLVNREDGEPANFNTFIDENTIYEPGQRYYEIFEGDTELFAVWRPVVYTINIFTQAYDSLINSSSGKIYLSKEKLIYNRNSITDNIVIEGNVVEYETSDGELHSFILATSAVAGYGLCAWTNEDGVTLQKTGNQYHISVLNDANNLFDAHPSSDNNSINIYPAFNILRYSVVFKLAGEGINSQEVGDQLSGLTQVSFDEVDYGVKLKDLLPKVYNAYFDSGYKFKGWNISGDVDSKGIIKDDYIANLASSNITVRSDLVITLVAEKLSYTIKLVFSSPVGETKEILNKTLDYWDTLDSLADEINQKLEIYQYVGYNFSYWQTAIGGTTLNLTQENLGGMRVTSPLDLYSKYSRANVRVRFNYECDGEQVVVKYSEFLSYCSLDTSSFEKQPIKAGCVLKGWTLDNLTQETYFNINSNLYLSEDKVGNYLYRPTIDADYYILDLYAKWVESLTLTFDTSEVDISYTNFPTALNFEKDSRVYFQDILQYISQLSNSTIRQKNGLGEYNGVWVDNNGNEYDVTLSSTYILMNDNLTIKPKFNPKSFNITYNYYYLGEFKIISDLTSIVSEQFSQVPILLSEENINNRISQIPELNNYRAKGYYLSKDAFENLDENFKFNTGDSFDFIDNPSYLSKAKDNNFDFYIILVKLVTLNYYSDDDSLYKTFTFEEGLDYIIGDTDLDGVVDYAPTKRGYMFKGWNAFSDSTDVMYANGQGIITGTVSNLYPVWQSAEVKLEYCDYDDGTATTNLLGYVEGLSFTKSPTLKSFASEGKTLRGWKLSPDGEVAYSVGQSLPLDDVRDYAQEEGGIFIIRLYAEWETASYSVTFETFTSTGTSNLMYGTLNGTLTTTETKVNYDSSTQLSFTFPNTAETYESDGQKYKFTGKWKSGAITYTSSTVTLTFTSNYEFKPVYEKVFTLTFKCGISEIYKVEDVSEGEEFKFDDEGLTQATEIYNNTLMATGSKIVSYSNNGDTYTSSSVIIVNSDLTFIANVVDLVSVVIYKDLNYNGAFDFTNSVKYESIELSTQINLSNYETTIADCATEGFVVSTNDNYIYNSTTTALVNGMYALSNSGASKGSTIYFYPVLKTTINYYVNSQLSDNEEVRFGNLPTKTNITASEGEYFSEWRVGSNSGLVYDGEIVTGAIDLYTIGRPFLQLQIASSDIYIKNATSLKIGGLKSSDVVSLPNASDVKLKDEYANAYSLAGWYISYAETGRFVMDGSEYKQYALGEEITLDDVISALGLGTIEEVYFNMHPVINYTFYTLSIKESANITYDVDIDLINTNGLSATEITDLENAFKNYGNDFKVHYGSAVTINGTNDTIKFVAFLENNGVVVKSNNSPVRANITISKIIDEGYESNGWIYYGTSNFVVSGATITKDTLIQAQTAVLGNIKLSVNLRYFDGIDIIDINEANIDSYDEYFYINGTSKHACEFDTKYGNLISFTIIINNGYQIYSFVDGYGNSLTSNITTSGNSYTFTHEVGETQIYVTIKKLDEFKPIISIDSSSISDYDSTKINYNSTMYVKYKEDYSWSYLYKDDAGDYELNWSEFSAGYQYINAIGINNYIQVYTSLNSDFYYVKEIQVYNDGSLLNNDGGENKVTGNQTSTEILVTGVLEIKLVLAERTYSINYYDANNSLVAGIQNPVENSIFISLPSLSRDGYTLQGFKVMSGSAIGDVQLVEYITSDKEFLLNELQQYSRGRDHSNQNLYILLQPVWVNNQITLTLVSDNGYFTLNGEKKVSIEINVPYDEELTFTKSVSDGVIISNRLSFVTKSYSVDNNGNANITSTNQEIVFVPLGNYNFVDGYVYDTNKLFNDTYTMVGDVEFAPKLEKGVGEISIIINESEIANCVNEALTLGEIVFTKNSIEETSNVVYDNNGSLTVPEFSFETADDCSVVINLSSAFELSSYDIVIDNNKLSDYVSLIDFVNEFDKLNIEIAYNQIIFSNLIYDVEIVYNVNRNDYAAYIQVASTSDTQLNEVFNQLLTQGEDIVTIGDVNAQVGTNVEIDSQDFRKIVTYELKYNTKYFDIKSIYYTDNGTTNIVFGAGVSENLSSFNPLNNMLTIVYGGELGNDINFYVELELTKFDVVFHNVDSIYSTNASDYLNYSQDLITPNETTDYAFKSSIILNNSQLFVPENSTYNGSAIEFIGWTYYNGNYESDLAKNEINNNRFVSLSSVEWQFGATLGNLHIFSNWNKLFTINFTESNDQFDAKQDNLPSSQQDVSLTDEIQFTIATREGFDFDGYSYVYDGDTYYLRYNGTVFTALENSNGFVTTLDSFNASQITLSQIITSQMADIGKTFNSINFEPIWSRNDTNLTIVNDENKGIIEMYKYDNNSYALGTFHIKTYSTIEVGTIELSEVIYNCLYVNDGNEQLGVIVVKPKTENYYKFGQFKSNNNVISGTFTLNGDTEIEIVYEKDYVPHVLNLTWDKPYDEVSYVISNTGDNTIKVGTFKNGSIESLNTINVGASSTYTSTYDQIIIYALRENEVSITISLSGYHFNTDNTEIELNISGTNNILSTTGDYILKANLVNVNLSQYMLSDLENASNEGGKYIVGYFAPVEEGGIIIDYDTELTTIEVNSIDYTISNLVSGTKLYFEKTTDSYELIQLLNGNVDITDSDENGNNIYLTLPSSGIYDVKVVFDYEYSLVDFKINDETYASAYFTTTSDTSGSTKNEQLIAFANLVVNGYENGEEYLSALFSDISLLTGEKTSNVESLLVKTNGIEKTYYTEGELITLFNYGINKNIAVNYFNNDAWANVWFEKFNFGSSYPSDQGITIDNLYIGVNVENVTFVAETSTALILAIESELETLDNGAQAQGGIALDGDKYAENYLVLGNSGLGYSDSYSKLYLKVKDNTILPYFSLIYDQHTYVTSSINFSGQVFSSADELGLKAEDYRYEYTCGFKVKQVKIMLTSTDEDESTNFEFEQNFANEDNPNYKIISVNYLTTFADIMAEYNLQNSYIVGENEYVFKGFYHNNTKIDDSLSMQDYLEGISYTNGYSIYLNAVYEMLTT